MMQMSAMEKKFEKKFWVLEKISFELILLNTHFYRDRIFVIWSQYVKKQSQNFKILLRNNFPT